MLNDIKKVIIYARVSTKNQDTDAQLLKLKEYCKNHNYQVVQILEDIWTGKNTKRSNYQKLLNEIHLKSFDILLVWKLDRLSRSLKDLIELWERLNQKDINLVSHDSSIDTTSSWWQLLFNMLWVFAEFQRSLIVENIKMGLEKAKSKWIKLWRKSTINQKYNTKLLNEALTLQTQWMSYRKIANILNIKDYSTLSKQMKKHKEKIKNNEIIVNTNIYDFINKN